MGRIDGLGSQNADFETQGLGEIASQQDLGAVAPEKQAADAAPATVDPEISQSAWKAFQGSTSAKLLEAEASKLADQQALPPMEVEPGQVDYTPDWQTMDEFYAESPPEMQQLDEAMDAALSELTKLLTDLDLSDGAELTSAPHASQKGAETSQAGAPANQSAPISLKATPDKTQNAPISLQATPDKTQNAPISLQAAPDKAQNAPSSQTLATSQSLQNAPPSKQSAQNAQSAPTAAPATQSAPQAAPGALGGISTAPGASSLPNSLSGLIRLMASALTSVPPDIGNLRSAAEGLDAAVLDHASRGDAAARSTMADSYGNSLRGGGAFGNLIDTPTRHQALKPAGYELLEIFGMDDTLMRGASGPKVSALQRALNAAGIEPPLDVDGQFGPASEAALKKFQAQSGLRADGVMGFETLGALDAALGLPRRPLTATAPAGYELLNSARAGNYLRAGSSGPAVRALQEALNRAGANPPLEVNGNLGATTEAAVRKLQNRRGCTIDGVVGPETLRALDGAIGLPTPRISPSSGSGSTSAPTGTTSVSAPGTANRTGALSAALGEIGVREATGNNDGIPADRYSRGRNVAWCANFVSWSFRQAGTPLPGNQWSLGSCDYMVDQMKAHGTYFDRGQSTPQAGDIIFFGVPGDSTHVGIVDRVEGGRVYTVEGNSGNRVAKRSYALNASRILGYGRP